MSSHAPNPQPGYPGHPAPPGSAGPRCLLYVPRGCDAPVDLIAGLAARRLYVREISTAPGVMAELARKSYTILITVFPGHAPDWPALLEAVRIYHPAISLWTYDAANPLRLNRLPAAAPAAAPDSSETPEAPEPREPRDVPQNTFSAGAAQAARATTQTTSHPHQPMTNPPTAPARPIAAQEARTSDQDLSAHQPLVTEEELAMLLGDEPLP